LRLAISKIFLAVLTAGGSWATPISSVGSSSRVGVCSEAAEAALSLPLPLPLLLRFF
jgi:hypothetical protein